MQKKFSPRMDYDNACLQNKRQKGHKTTLYQENTDNRIILLFAIKSLLSHFKAIMRKTKLRKLRVCFCLTETPFKPKKGE